MVQLLQLIERFLLGAGLALLLLVVSGHAITIKNHWLHPYLFLLPMYLTLRLWTLGTIRIRYANRLFGISMACAFVVLVAFPVKPMTSGVRGKYSWLNMPYKELSSWIQDDLVADPTVILTPDMRTAGNLRLRFPATNVVSQDHAQLEPAGVIQANLNNPGAPHRVIALAVMDRPDAETRQRLESFAEKQLSREALIRWQTVRLPYRFGRPGDEHEFAIGVIEEASNVAPICQSLNRAVTDSECR